MSDFQLPDAPADMQGPVKAWAAPVTIPTYLPLPADKNPMFLEKRVYQGSSGRVYPLPFVDRISEEKTDRAWEAIHIENEYVRLMILPELGGRIHVGFDKVNQYDFFYRQQVIKPALVGLAGPWISGGVEFNWPQHHRPSTFMRCDWEIEKRPDGSVIVWCGEHEPMQRMKGMHGICLRPGSSLIELKVRIYNRTEFMQSFLWWANVGVRVHEQYQSFFPPDVTHVADHAKRAMARFPLCEGKYYGVDYAARRDTKTDVRNGVRRAGNDLSWYENIPVPTSYMAMGSKEDFFGGYDHAKQAGFVHVADHHIAPGKKQWTWGNHAFGRAWDRNLSDDGGPYIELMAGVYTDNQPDFSWLMPGETRSWSQYWYPIQKVGVVQKANEEAALSLRVEGAKIRIGAMTTRVQERALVQLWRAGVILHQSPATLAPNAPLVMEYVEPQAIPPHELTAYVLDSTGRTLIKYQPAPPREKVEVPAAAKEPALPADVGSVEELYLIGLHLEQYRHATRMPEEYWLEALKRDPADSRCHTALGWWRLKRGEFGKAAEHFRTAIAGLTKYNPNPREGEAYYGLGITLRYLGQHEKAYDALAKAAWNAPWQSAAHFAMAQLECLKQRWPAAAEHLDRVFQVNREHLQARHLTALVLLRMNREKEARALLEETLRLDRLDFSAQGLLGIPLTCDTDIRLDIAADLAKAGFYHEAMMAFNMPQSAQSGQFGVPSGAFPMRPLAEIGGEYARGQRPMMAYTIAFLLEKMRTEGNGRAREAAKAIPPDYCFPSRLEEIGILLAAIGADETDARAPYYLGNLLYDRRRREEAINWWEKAAKLDRTFSIPWRNLGIAYFNVYKDMLAAKGAYERAFKADTTDARVLYERDQLWKCAGETPQRRLEELKYHAGLVFTRDDLTIEWCALLNQIGEHDKAMQILRTRRFQPWEGGEGQVLAQWARTHIAMGRAALWQHDAAGARALFGAGLAGAPNLGEAAHLLANQSELLYWAGMAALQGKTAADAAAAKPYLTRAGESGGADFQQMALCAFSEATYFSALALKELGRAAEGRKLLEAMEAYARGLRPGGEPVKIDYFATSLPAMLLFEEDMQARQAARATLLEALALHGLGDKKTARRLLGDLLRDDPNHVMAADLMRSLSWE